MNRFIFAAVIALTASSAFAAPAPAPAPSADAPKPEAAAAPDGKEKLICVRERSLGSNRTKRVCRTAEQMANDSEETRDALIRGENVTPPPGSTLY